MHFTKRERTQSDLWSSYRCVKALNRPAVFEEPFRAIAVKSKRRNDWSGSSGRARTPPQRYSQSTLLSRLLLVTLSKEKSALDLAMSWDSQCSHTSLNINLSWSLQSNKPGVTPNAECLTAESLLFCFSSVFGVQGVTQTPLSIQKTRMGLPWWYYVITQINPWFGFHSLLVESSISSASDDEQLLAKHITYLRERLSQLLKRYPYWIC